ncbi:MAG: SDR family NAD(P)-dependent oxidoreductase [Dehalococcoidia bacterium]|nr:SDR family NAD(P)-dependent oxidoreductase [Dehalococcoidia bacterium]
MNSRMRTAIVTGASSGIGEATARSLAAAGFDVVAGARRVDRIDSLAREIGGRAFELDVTSEDSVQRFAESVPEADVLVNNAGGAHGVEPVAAFDEDNWRTMWETNVLGLMRVTRAFLPKLEASGNGHIVNVASVASTEVYAGGSGYTSAKHAVRAIDRTLRLELLGKPIRITEVAPGMVQSEFALVRLGDEEKARKLYEGLTILTSEDIAECITFAVTRPPHVNIDEMLVRPLDQVNVFVLNRKTAT